MCNSYDPKYTILHGTESILKIQEATVVFKTFSFLVAEDSEFYMLRIDILSFSLSAAYSILRNLGARKVWAD